MDFASVQEMFTSLPVDVVASILFATIITVDTLRSGASRAISISLALALTTVLYAILPGTYGIGAALSTMTEPLLHTAIFGALFVILAFIIHRMTGTYADDSSRPHLALITGAATTIVVLTIWQISPELRNLWDFHGSISLLFGEAFRLYWILVAFIAFAFVKS